MQCGRSSVLAAFEEFQKFIEWNLLVTARVNFRQEFLQEIYTQRVKK